MSEENKLTPELDKKLRDYIANNYESVQDFDYKISENGEEITLSGKLNMPNSEVFIGAIKDVEKMLNVTYVNVMSLNGVYSFIYKFNEDK